MRCIEVMSRMVSFAAVPSNPYFGPARRVHGALRGRVHFAEDFDELPDDIAAAFGAR